MPGRFQGDLPERTRRFALQILALVDDLPNNNKGWVIAKQLTKSGTSIGANVREASEAQTDAEFVSKCSIARNEASETEYWLQLCLLGEVGPAESVEPVEKEADELLRIRSTIVRKTQSHLSRQ